MVILAAAMGFQAVVGDVHAVPGDAAADRVYGQPGFTSSTCNTTGVSAASLCFEHGVAIDASGRLYVADASNHRILEYDSPLTSSVADRVIGQPDFSGNTCNNGGMGASTLCNPIAVALDAAGRLYVADANNSRVLEYDSPLTSPVADRVIGQPNFTTGTCNTGGISASTLCTPTGLAVDAPGRLYVADANNNRVLEYDSPLTNSVSSRVYGQPDFSTSTANTTATSVWAPIAVAVDAAGRLYIADTGNSRVLEFDSPLASAVADRVIGQAAFTLGTCNGGGISAASLCDPRSIAVDAAGRLYVADTGNSRVLEYKHPLTSAVADRVFGQPTFGTDNCNSGGISESSLCQPTGVGLDTNSELYVGDHGNNRVLQYELCLAPDNDAPGGPFGGTQPWIADGVAPEGSTTGGDACDPNDDNNGCLDAQEPLELPARDPLNPWDWADMWVPSLPPSGPPSSGRNGAITLSDVSAALIWVGATNDSSNVNVNGRDYDADVNANGVEDGAEYDRTPAGGGTPATAYSGPPNGAVTLSDVSVILIQVGDAC